MLQRVIENSIETKLRSATTSPLGGHWIGQYDYPFAEPGVPFVATLSHESGGFTGTSSEPNTFSRAGGSHLIAELNGVLTADSIEFSKVYRNVADATHTIFYSGILSPTQDRIEGEWYIPIPWRNDFGGSFWMKKDKTAHPAPED
ncbi:hypothetical protein [Maricaulis parjimensis]|uniref:hypothetical protein n=1 Tax=Maricaulis parjimensis TaxID=144023 RepID=UPI001939ACB4|nr:hypothetical protein [Maricaulis parjimensis]